MDHVQRGAMKQWLTALATDVIESHLGNGACTTSAASLGPPEEAGRDATAVAGAGAGGGEARRRPWTSRRTVAPRLDQLSPEQQEVVKLRLLAGLSHGEIARRLDLPLGTVRSRFARARRRLDTLDASDARDPSQAPAA